MKKKTSEDMGGRNLAEMMKGKQRKVTLSYEELSLLSAALCSYIVVWTNMHIECPKTKLLLGKITNEIIKIRENVTNQSQKKTR